MALTEYDTMKRSAEDSSKTEDSSVEISDAAKAHVGPLHKWDSMGRHQFDVLVEEGLGKESSLLDVGCGCLRGGLYFIDWIGKKNYYGIEPYKEVLLEGLDYVEADTVADVNWREENFKSNEDLNIGLFRRKFDFVLYQSIFTHTGPKLMREAFRSLNTHLGEGTAYLTILLKPRKAFTDKVADNQFVQWTYPYCRPWSIEHLQDAAIGTYLVFEIMGKMNHPNRLTWIKCQKK
jgi:hypothetical protein